MPDLEGSEIEYLVYSLSLGKEERSRDILMDLASEFYGEDSVRSFNNLAYSKTKTANDAQI